MDANSKLNKLVEDLEFKVLNSDSQILLTGGKKNKEVKNNCHGNCGKCNEPPSKKKEKTDTVIPNNCKGGNCIASPMV